MHHNAASPKNRKRDNYLLLLLCSITLAVLFVTIVSVTGKGLRGTNKESLSVNGNRPVALAAETLEKKYGWLITYEDPPYVHESDLLDVTEKVRRDLDKFKPGQAPRILIPKGGELAFEYSIDSKSKRPADSAVVVQQLLDAYAVANPGIFRLDRDGQRLHIVAIAAKNTEGVLVPRRSVLDVSITVPEQKRNGLQLLDAFCATVTAASGTRVLLAGAPLTLFHNSQTEAGAKDQRARDFLTRQLDQISGGPKLSWELLYAADEKTYYLNIY